MMLQFDVGLKRIILFVSLFLVVGLWPRVVVYILAVIGQLKLTCSGFVHCPVNLIQKLAKEY